MSATLWPEAEGVLRVTGAVIGGALLLMGGNVEGGSGVGAGCRLGAGGADGADVRSIGGGSDRSRFGWQFFFAALSE